MNVKQKLGYMLIGCLFTIAGYILASLGDGATHAQQNEQVIDKIVCRELEVVNKDGKTFARIGADAAGGVIGVLNAAGKEVAGIGAAEDGNGVIGVLNAAGKLSAGIGATKDGRGAMLVYNATGKAVVGIGVTEDGGDIVVRNAAGKEVVSIGAAEDGNGVIETYKGGWRRH